jgi:hypothetical protein
MALPTLEGRTPTSIKAITVHLYSIIEDVGDPPVPTEVRRASFSLVAADQNGVDMNPINGDAQPHLTAGEISALQTLMDAWRARAEAALPAP